MLNNICTLSRLGLLFVLNDEILFLVRGLTSGYKSWLIVIKCLFLLMINDENGKNEAALVQKEKKQIFFPLCINILQNLFHFCIYN